MGDDMYEPFKINDWDLENEFNHKRTKKPSKNSNIYGKFRESLSNALLTKPLFVLGMFAESDDEEDDRRKKAKSSGPISFVSGGVKGDAKEHEEDMEVDSPPRTSFRPAASSSKPTRFANEFAGVSTQMNKGIGTWENHTKGIGAKLLLKMGYEPGKGLGKDKQGITAPIEAKKREGSGAIGFYGPEHKQKAVFSGDLEKKEEEKKSRQKDSDGRVSVKGSKGKQKLRKTYVYKTVEEVLAAEMSGGHFKGHDKHDIDVFATKVIDMRGPEQKVLSGYHEMNQKTISVPSQGLSREEREILELQRDLNILVDMTEQAVIKSNRNIRREKERLRYLEDERAFVKTSIAEQRKDVDSLESVVNALSHLTSLYESDQLTSDELLEFCRVNKGDLVLQQSLTDLIQSMAFPLIKNELASWRPISEPQRHCRLFSSWREVLLKMDRKVYDALVWKLWMPLVRREIMQWPSMKQCDQLIAFLEAWKKLLPGWVLNNVLEQIIIPRLEKEVEEWNPLTDPVPVHSWIHPWLPLTSSTSLETVYQPIRRKLSTALSAWHPSDGSAKLILSPWRGVFSQATWDSFLAVNIVPKLDLSMQAFKVSPHQQRLENWNCLIAWNEFLPPTTVGRILEKHFFPKWLQALHQWLSDSPDYDEISNWYLGWKGMIPSGAANQSVVKDYFRRALEMMDFAVTSPLGIAGYQSSTANITPAMAEQIRLRHDILSAATNAPTDSNLNFKQLIERKADENGILFMPITNKHHDGKQVYSFGKLKIYMDRSVVFLFNAYKNNWSPISLQALLESA